MKSPHWRYASFVCRCLLAVLLPAALLSGQPALGQATPPADLLRLVPDDVTFCLVVQDLRTHANKLAASNLVKRFHATPLGKTIAAELQDLRNFDEELKRHFQVGWQQIQDEILGDCTVFAFHHDAGGEKEERGLLLVSVKNEKLLARLIERINEIQLEAGEIEKVEKRLHGETTYRCRLAAQGRSQFYLHAKSLFVFTNDESLMRQVIERRPGAALKKSAIVKSFQQLPRSKALATLWGNPRAFDGELRAKVDNAGEPAEGHVLKTWSRYWQALDAFAVAVDVGPDVELLLTLQGQPEDLPKHAQKLLFPTASPNGGDLWSRFPDTAAVAFAGQIDSQALLHTLEEFMIPTARKEFRGNLEKNINSVMGRDFVKKTLPLIGPDAGFFVAAAAEKETVPHTVIALRIQRGPDDGRIDDKIISALNFYARLAALTHNLRRKDSLEVQTVRRENIDVTYLSSPQFSRGFEPAFAMKDGFLVLASSPAAMDQFRQRAAKPGPTPLVRISFREMAKLLKQNQNLVAASLAQQNQVPDEIARQLLDDAAATLQLFERLEIDQESAEGQVTYRLRLVVGQVFNLSKE